MSRSKASASKGSRRGKSEIDDEYADNEEYEHLTEHERVLVRPGMYVGTIQQISREAILVNKRKVFIENIKIPSAMERIFLEILNNAADNINRSIRYGYHPGDLQIYMNKKEITVTNFGRPISIKIDKKTNLYIPEMIFGLLGSGSNYGDENTGIGMNGLGAKLTNIYSKYFHIDVKNADEGKRFEKTWEDNMYKSNDYKVSKFDGNESSVSITYEADFERFGYKEYNQDAFDLYMHSIIYTSWICRTDIFFNDVKYRVKNIVDYAKMIYNDEVIRTGISWYDWTDAQKEARRKDSPGGKMEFLRKGKVERMYNKLGDMTPNVELLILYTPDEGDIHISFVNSLYTPNGGLHVDAAYKAILGEMVTSINKEIKDKGMNNRITVADLRKHVTLIISCYNVVNPQFDSQNKTKLTSPEFKMKIPAEVLEKTKKWGILDKIRNKLAMKQLDDLNRHKKNKKMNHINISGFHDAINAGKKGTDTMLIICEGESASNLPGMIGDPDNIGIFPIRGKSLNVRNKSLDRVAKNQELKYLIEVLRLDTEVDYRKSRDSLRYKKLIIFTDPDLDGEHIAGLLLNFFDVMYPTLIQCNEFFYRWDVPIVVLSYKGKIRRFYTEYELEFFFEENPDARKAHMKYFKGLGTLSGDHANYVIKNPHFMKLIYDKNTPHYLDMSFNGKRSDDRKKWIDSYDPQVTANIFSEIEETKVHPDEGLFTYGGDTSIKEVTISKFVRYKYVAFAEYSMIRSIPNFYDMKPSQRMIMYCAFFLWGKAASGKMKKNFLSLDDNDNEQSEDFNEGKCSEKDLIKIIKDDENKLNTVNSFTGNVKSNTEYKHGEINLAGTIVNLAAYYPCENNLPMLQDHGFFGSRTVQKAAAPRYIYTKLSNITKFIFRDEDDGILDYIPASKLDFPRGHIEPKQYYPLIPMYLVNGSIGIGSGVSTCCLNHHPIDLVDFFLDIIEGKDPEAPIPWYRGFNGTIEIVQKEIVDKKLAKMLKVEKKKTAVEDEEDEDKDEVDVDDDEKEDKDESKIKKTYVVIKGNYEVDGDEITVTELPVGVSVEGYKKSLNKKLEKGKISDYISRSFDNTVEFKIYGFRDFQKDEDGNQVPKEINHYNLGLSKAYSYSNMVLIRDNKPVKYTDIKDLLYDFFDARVEVYEKRKKYMVKHLNEEINKMNEFMKFIYAVAVDKTIEVRNKSKKQIHEQMRKHGIDESVYTSSVTLYHLMTERIKELEKKIEKVKNLRDYYLNTPADQIYKRELFELRDALEVFYKLYGNGKNSTLSGKAKKAPAKPKAKRSVKGKK